MIQITDAKLLQLNMLNKWLSDVYGENTKLSTLLNETGINKNEIETIKTKHLPYFIDAVGKLIANNIANHDGERRNSVMVRHYGLTDGKPETLQTIGDSLNLSRERIRQLIQKRLRFYKSIKQKERFKQELTALAQRLLEQ